MMRAQLLMCLLLTLAAGALAQQQIAPGDELSVSVANSKNLTGSYKVGPDGTILMPFLGAVEVQGLTLSEAADKVARILREQRVVLDPQVTVSYADGLPSTASVTGAVKKPGDLQADETTTLDDLLREAQPTDNADLSSVRLTLPDGTKKTVDYGSYKRAGFLSGNPLVPPGSSVYVTILPDVQDVTVLGAVANPGVIPHEPGLTLVRALIAAGGTKDDADLTRIRIKRRSGEQLEANMETVGATTLIEPGDQVFVPVTAGSTYIMVRGAVRNPGLVPYREKMTLMEAVRAAGQPTDNARLNRVEIRRVEDSQTTTTVVDLDQVLRGQASDPEVRAGDTVVVPYPARGLSAGEALRYAWILITILLLLRRS
jgi:polysaccharide export outer membrane protein